MLRLHPPQHHAFWTAQAHVITSLLLARAAVPVQRGSSQRAVMQAVQQVRCLTTGSRVKTGRGKELELAKGLTTSGSLSTETARGFSVFSKTSSPPSTHTTSRTVSTATSLPTIRKSMIQSSDIFRQQQRSIILTALAHRRSLLGTISASSIQAEIQKRGQTRQFHGSESRRLPAPAVIFAAGALLKVSSRFTFLEDREAESREGDEREPAGQWMGGSGDFRAPKMVGRSSKRYFGRPA
jgi:hypothetical protein